MSPRRGIAGGASKELSACVQPLSVVPQGPSASVSPFIGQQIYECREPVARCVRAWFTDTQWFRDSMVAGVPLWQVSLYVMESTEGGPIVTARPLRARGRAINVGPWKVAVGVGAQWLGGIAPAPNQLPTGLVYVSVTEQKASASVHQCGNVQAQSDSLGPFTIDPDAVFDNGTFYGGRFAEAVRVHWSAGNIAGVPPFPLWQYRTTPGPGPVRTVGTFPYQAAGTIDLTVDVPIAVEKLYTDVSLSFQWVTYA